MRAVLFFLSFSCLGFPHNFTHFLNSSTDSFDETSFEITRILSKRDVLDNILKDDPSSKCRNGGIWAGGKCHCIHPNTGPTCQDFACVHGISVGARYNPNIWMFTNPCLCDDGWKGELCEYQLTARCNQRGEWKGDSCHCIGSFFGDSCQFTSRCDFGTIKHGRCICSKHYHGDYCEKATCYHGYPNLANHSRSCTCPVKYKGTHCNQCSQIGRHILPYPTCVVDFVPHERHMRKKTKHQNKSRIVIIISAIVFLAIVGVLMLLGHVIHQRRKNPQEEARRQIALQERQEMLQQAAALNDNEPESVQNTVTSKKERRRSLPNIFRLKHSASSDRVLRLREQRGSLPREDTF